VAYVYETPGVLSATLENADAAAAIDALTNKKYAGTGGWGFADFTDGKPADEAVHKTCFPCHEPAKARDFVFTRYAP
jgi:hypothetical protein